MNLRETVEWRKKRQRHNVWLDVAFGGAIGTALGGSVATFVSAMIDAPLWTTFFFAGAGLVGVLILWLGRRDW